MSTSFARSPTQRKWWKHASNMRCRYPFPSPWQPLSKILQEHGESCQAGHCHGLEATTRGDINFFFKVATTA